MPRKQKKILAAREAVPPEETCIYKYSRRLAAQHGSIRFVTYQADAVPAPLQAPLLAELRKRYLRLLRLFHRLYEGGSGMGNGG